MKIVNIEKFVKNSSFIPPNFKKILGQVEKMRKLLCNYNN